MNKIFILLFILIFALPSQAAFWNRKDKALEAELQGKGYAGTLPVIENQFQKKEDKISKPIFETQKGFNDPSELKPVPRSNPAYIDIITKQDKVSAYVTDANEIIPLLEKLADSIEEEDNLQLFITRANVVTMNLDHLQKKYEGEPESYYDSFRKLMEINQYAKTVSQLRREAVTYQRYLAYQASGSIYNPENINRQLQYLLEEINNAIIMLKQEG